MAHSMYYKLSGVHSHAASMLQLLLSTRSTEYVNQVGGGRMGAWARRRIQDTRSANSSATDCVPDAASHGPASYSILHFIRVAQAQHLDFDSKKIFATAEKRLSIYIPMLLYQKYFGPFPLRDQMMVFPIP
jgi:hypothetical protein